MKAFLFPGQGSQRKGMGAELFSRFPEMTAQADAVLGYSIRELCVTDAHKQLSQTQFTQPALFVVNALTYLDLVEREGRPAVLAGHSLGEYSALWAAGVFDFVTGVRLVQKRGALMAAARGGGMAAVLGLEPERIEAVLRAKSAGGVDVANFNEPSQTVISGPIVELEQLQAPMVAAGAVRFMILPVSAAFHSRYMQPASQEFAGFLREFTFAAPTVPVIANVTARPYEAERVGEYLTRQIRESVRWMESMRLLMACGVAGVKECGPGEVLTNLWRNIQKKAPPMVLSPEEIARVLEPRTSGAVAPGPRSTGEAEEAVPLPTTQSVLAGSALQGPFHSAPRNGASVPEVAPTAFLQAESLSVRGPQAAPERKPTGAPFTHQASSRSGADGLLQVTAETLGSDSFRRAYGLRMAYLAGGMYKGISSIELVVRLGRAGLMAFLGTGGLPLSRVESDIRAVQEQLTRGEAWGANLLSSLETPQLEADLVDLFLRYRIRTVEAAGYLSLTPSVVLFRGKGARRDARGQAQAANRVIAKVSRPEVAQAFLSPPPERILRKLIADRLLTGEEAEAARLLPVCSDLCVMADSGGPTDMGSPYCLLPTMIRLRDQMMLEHRYASPIHVGAAGGIGTPEAALAALMLGAEFLATGSINQCSPEAATSESVKDLLQSVNIQDTDYAPSGDMFELGGRVQVLRKGVFFPARAKKLFELYSRYESWEAIDQKTRDTLEQRYFTQSAHDIWGEIRAHLAVERPEALAAAERDPRQKLALIFRWYFEQAHQLALQGNPDRKVDYQVYCGPAMGAFNQFVKGTALENWRSRHVDVIADHLMQATAELVRQRFGLWMGGNREPASVV